MTIVIIIAIVLAVAFAGRNLFVKFAKRKGERTEWDSAYELSDPARKTVITAWIRRYNETRPHSSLGYLTPAAWRKRQAQLTA